MTRLPGLMTVMLAAAVGLGNSFRVDPALRPPISFQAQPWPQADALFHKDPKWLGGDDAYSVDLGNGRVLWLFGDSFISTSHGKTRRESTLIKNTIAIESGYDPSTATIRFYWRTHDGSPKSFFPERRDEWYWPGDGIAVGGKLFLFFMTVRPTGEGLGFELTGWKAAVVSNFHSDPLRWRLRFAKATLNTFGVTVSGPVIREGAYILAFGYRQTGANLFLLRWPVAEILNADFARPQWWDAKTGWIAQSKLVAPPRPIMTDGQAEFSVSFQPLLQQFLIIQTVGFGQAAIGFRRSDALTGPWTKPQGFYRPEEGQLPRIMVYAAKCHQELQGAPLILTYATNKPNLTEVVDDPSLYFPRFLKIKPN